MRETAKPADGKRQRTKKLDSTSSHPRTQAEKFEAAARELGCDPNEDRFKDVLRKLAKPKQA